MGIAYRRARQGSIWALGAVGEFSFLTFFFIIIIIIKGGKGQGVNAVVLNLYRLLTFPL